jgi:hypothetical protein
MERVNLSITYEDGLITDRLAFAGQAAGYSFGDYEEELLCSSPSLALQRPRRRRMQLLKVLLRTAEFVVVSLLACIIIWMFLLPYCDFIFQCGCTWKWAGATNECNINDPSLPSCPWCAAPLWEVRMSQAFIFLCIIATYYGLSVLWSFLPCGRARTSLVSPPSSSSDQGEDDNAYIHDVNPSKRSVVSTCLSLSLLLGAKVTFPFAMFFVSGLLMAWLFYLASDYPTFL